MIELSTGYLDFEQLEEEIIAIADDFKAFGIGILYVTFGVGCRIDRLVQAEEVPVPTSEFARFVADCEAIEAFELGEADLHVRGGGIKFLLCHERDVHCSGEESPNLLAVRRRWMQKYEHACERRSGGGWRRLSGRPKDTRNP